MSKWPTYQKSRADSEAGVGFKRTIGTAPEQAAALIAEQDATARLFAAAPTLAEALREIAGCAGNLPDEQLTTRTGASDAVARGLMVTRMRAIARAALKAAGCGE